VWGDDIKHVDAFFQRDHWLFGHLSYELNNALHQLPPTKTDRMGFAPYYFFSPQVVLSMNNGLLTIYADKPHELFQQLVLSESDVSPAVSPLFEAKPVLSKEEYIRRLKALQAHILRGDCYEINFCQEFVAEGVRINPFASFQKLMDVSPNPFSAFYRNDNSFVLCASPERFLTRKGKKLISQPIKGTIQRDLADKVRDEQLRESLRLSQKEQAENVMVVDLVRNDLARICQPASVAVEELFGIYSFPQVHQMISTVSGELREDASFSQILEATFPMGSMTGAPKRSVMRLIDKYEPSARGIFSGSIGYKAPNGDFDFNVVIRSILYNQSAGVLSYQVGSGITFYSDAEKEWEECMLKAAAIRKVLS
jgi:para-aminobenzoate synthetase component 1